MMTIIPLIRFMAYCLVVLLLILYKYKLYSIPPICVQIEHLTTIIIITFQLL